MAFRMRSVFITLYRENMAFVFHPPIFITVSSDTPASRLSYEREPDHERILGGQEETRMAQRFNRPKAAGGNGFAQYSYGWSKIGVRLSTKRVAVGALGRQKFSYVVRVETESRNHHTQSTHIV